MKKRRLISATFLLLIVVLLSISLNVYGGEAGVGVINLPPEYQDTQIITEEDVVKIKLNISDYNSWQDILKSVVTIRTGDEITGQFTFQQYESASSFTLLEEFIEDVSTDHLILSDCTCVHSDETETIEDRCLLYLVFTFYPTSGSQLSITTYDRGGLTATTFVEYDVQGMPRSKNAVMLPWMTTPITIHLETIDALCCAFAITAVAILLKKNTKKMKEILTHEGKKSH